MSPKNSCKNLYYHPFSLSKGEKLFSYLTSFSRRGPVNPSAPNLNYILHCSLVKLPTPTPVNIVLRQIITNFLVIDTVNIVWENH